MVIVLQLWFRACQEKENMDLRQQRATVTEYFVLVTHSANGVSREFFFGKDFQSIWFLFLGFSNIKGICILFLKLE